MSSWPSLRKRPLLPWLQYGHSKRPTGHLALSVLAGVAALPTERAGARPAAARDVEPATRARGCTQLRRAIRNLPFTMSLARSTQHGHPSRGKRSRDRTRELPIAMRYHWSEDTSILRIARVTLESALLLVLTAIVAGCSQDQLSTAAATGAEHIRVATWPTLPGDSGITFAHLTDPHLFDAGSGRHDSSVYEEALDNRAALNWSIIEINRIDVGVRRIDFAVVTGDWGLDNVQLPSDVAEMPQRQCRCPPPRGGGEGPIPPVSLEAAANEVANAFRALVVPTIYLVPGEHDICAGDLRDLHRYVEFVLELQRLLPGRIVDLTHTAERLMAH